MTTPDQKYAALARHRDLCAYSITGAVKAAVRGTTNREFAMHRDVLTRLVAEYELADKELQEYGESEEFRIFMEAVHS